VKRVTFKEIAETVGCSRTAVSVVLGRSHGNAGVGPKLRKRIEQVADKLGYEMNYHAQALRSGRAGAVGLLLGGGAGAHRGLFGQIVNGIDSYVCKHENDLIIVGQSADNDQMDYGIQYLRQGRIDALVMLGQHFSYSILNRDDRPFPIVAAIPPAGTKNYAVVDMDYTDGVTQAITHLHEHGHRELLMIQMAKDTGGYLTARQKIATQLAKKFGIKIQVLKCESTKLGSTNQHQKSIVFFRDKMQEYLNNNTCPSAILAHNELCGIGVTWALRDAGLSVPDDVSLIAFDNLWAELAVPPMSVIDLNLQGVGREAAKLALELAENEDWVENPPKRFVPTNFIIRESTGPAK
jgi:DNA-binding LacI/PurR family transcriptional regulator